MQMQLLGVILLATIALFVTQVVRLEVTSLLVLFALVATGILTLDEALAGFANPATVTIGAMFILSAGLVRTGVIERLTAGLLRIGGVSGRRLLLPFGFLTTGLSAFMNNTPVVVMLMPVALSLGRRFGVAPSKLLIPLSYLAILGGTCTLIGTSTNIVVHSLYRQAGGPGFRMFEFSPLGVAFVVLGSVYLWLAAGKLLPVRSSLSQILDVRQRTGFVTELRVPAGSKWVGRPVRSLFSGAQSAHVLQLWREEEVVPGSPLDTPVEAGDTLLIEAGSDDLERLLARSGVEYGSAVADEERVSVSGADVLTVEAVVAPGSSFVNRELSHIGLNRRFGVKVLALRRLGRQHQYRLRGMRLRVGDVLLIQGDARALEALRASGDALLLEGGAPPAPTPGRAAVAMAIMAAVVGLATFDVMPIAALSLAGVAAMLLTRCLSASEAFRSLDATVLLLLAGTIPLGVAMEKTGMASLVAGAVLGYAGDYGPVVLLSAFYLLTNVFTAFLSNTATAALLTPIAFGIAAESGVDPRPFLVTIAFAASADFATPIGYQTNTMVMGPGGYLFRDYLRIGLPLHLILWLAATLLIPAIWPF